MKSGKLAGVMAGLLAGSVFAGENLLKNGDFEMGNLAGWGNWTPGARMRILKEGAHGGKYCCEYAVDSDKGGVTVNRVPLVSNKTYTVSGWVRGDAGVLEVRLFYSDANGKYMGESTAFKAAKLAKWTHFAKVFTTSAMCGFVSVGVSVARGAVQADDLRIEEGNHVGEAPNEIPNSDFGYILHENGMPDLWNTGGGYSFNTFQPGVHEGKFYRMAPEEPAPVPGARVLWQREIRHSWWKTGPLAGDTDYVLSIYAKSPDPKATMELDFGTNKQSFALSNAWQRLVLRTHLKNGVGNGYPRINFGGFPVYLSAPMLHAGTEPLAWKPSPLDVNFADLKGGTQVPPKASGIATLDVPESSDWSGAAKITDFHPLARLSETESGKFRAFVRKSAGTLYVAIEEDTGAKPKVTAKEGYPLVIGNDAAEVFLSSSDTSTPYIQFMGGRNGASAATYGMQGSAFKSGWTFTATETAKGWRGEYAIPLDLLPKPQGTCWRFNVGVTDFVRAKGIYYSAIPGGFHAGAMFMRLTGLPLGSKVAKPLFAAAEFDACQSESTVRVKVRDAEGAATATLCGGRGATALPSVPVVDGRAAFDIASLAPGAYEIEVSAANGKSTTHFRKFAAGEHFTRINRFKKQIEVDGKPFFPTVFNWSGLGKKLPTVWEIEQLKSHNFNTIMPELYCSWDRSYTTEYRTQVLKAFSEAGFKFLIWSDAGVDFKSKDHCIDKLVAARQKQIDELAAFKKDILGWYYVDEIGAVWEDWYGVKLEDYARGYRAMKDHDPGRLHFINWNWTGFAEGLPFYAEDGASDIYSIDCYPYSNDLYGYGALSEFDHCLGILNERIEDRCLPGIAWLQTYNYVEGTREPMPVEYRNNVCIALINRVTGFMHFIGCPEAKDLWDEMGRDYGFALKFLEMTAQPGAEMLARGKKGTISYALWKDGRGGYALVAANTLYAPQREMIPGRGDLRVGRRIELIGGEGELKIGTDGALDIALPNAGSAVWFIR